MPQASQRRDQPGRRRIPARKAPTRRSKPPRGEGRKGASGKGIGALLWASLLDGMRHGHRG